MSEPVGKTRFGLDQIYDSPWWSGPNFHPYIQNIQTGSRRHLGHHCKDCNGAIKRSCFEDLHLAFCTEWIKMEPNGTWRRCGEVFRVKSGGCHKHPSVHGYNAGFKKALITKEFDPEDFKNKNLPQQTAVDPEQLVREHAQNIVAKADAKVDSKFPARGNDNAEVDQERAEQSSDELPHVKFNRLQLEADRTAAALRKEKKNADREAKAEEDKSRKKIVQASLNKQGKPKWWKANGKKNDENEKQNENSTLDDSEAFASSNLKNKKKRRAERLAQVLTLK